jgi:hypothetical protein
MMKPNSDVDGEFVELFERFVSLRYPIAGCIGGKNMVIVANQWGAHCPAAVWIFALRASRSWLGIHGQIYFKDTYDLIT